MEERDGGPGKVAVRSKESGERASGWPQWPLLRLEWAEEDGREAEKGKSWRVGPVKKGDVGHGRR